MYEFRSFKLYPYSPADSVSYVMMAMSRQLGALFNKRQKNLAIPDSPG
jgi:hypothetical protein